jgi:hypothetical protein
MYKEKKIISYIFGDWKVQGLLSPASTKHLVKTTDCHNTVEDSFERVSPAALTVVRKHSVVNHYPLMG